jgi:hypothetical protein
MRFIWVKHIAERIYQNGLHLEGRRLAAYRAMQINVYAGSTNGKCDSFQLILIERNLLVQTSLPDQVHEAWNRGDFDYGLSRRIVVGCHVSH